MDNVKALLNKAKPKRDGDLIDRVNYSYTVIILVVFTFFIALWSFVGSPIQCWYPAYFKGWWVQYANDYCFVSSTYYHKFYNVPHLPTNYETQQEYYNEPQLGYSYGADAYAPEIIRYNNNSFSVKGEKRVLPYYQWTYILLALQAVLFYVPAVIWRTFNSSGGKFTNTILEMATSAENMSATKRKEKMAAVAKYMDHSCRIHIKLRQDNKYPSFFHGHMIVGLYLLVKFLYFLNALVQFFVLNAFIGHGNFNFGYETLASIFNGNSWIISQKFPRVTLCEFMVRELAVVQMHKVQCVLILNMFNEKFFTFLWWWYIFLTILNFASLVQWIFNVVYYAYYGDFISDMLPTAVINRRNQNKRIKYAVDDFLRNYLTTDGVFIIKLVGINSGNLVARQLLISSWEKYLSHHAQLMESFRQPPTTPSDPPKIKKPPVRLAKKGDDEDNRSPFANLLPSPPPNYDESSMASQQSSPSVHTPPRVTGV